MKSYTKNNHVKWGWGDGWFNRPSGNLMEQWKFTTGSITRNHFGFRKESIIAAREMCDSTELPIMLAFSGGIDSQVVFLSLIEAGVNFTPIIIRYRFKDSYLNDHDISAAFEMCGRYHIKPIEEILDVEHCWFDKEDFIHKHMIGDVSRLTILMTAEKYNNYYFIMGGGDPVLFPDHNYEWVWIHNPTPHLQYFINENRQGNTKFFWWSPEYILSQIDNPPMEKFEKALKTYTLTFEDYCENFKPKRQKYFSELYCDWCKPLIYNDAFPELIQRKKYVGFEKFAESLGPAYMQKLMGLFKIYNEVTYKRDIHINIKDLILRMKTGQSKIWNSVTTELPVLQLIK